jgi:hypothetical protein
MNPRSLRYRSSLLLLAVAVTGLAWAQEDKRATPEAPTKAQEVEIRRLIEQLALSDREAPDPKKLIEGVKTGELEVEDTIPPMPPELQEKPDPDYAKRFKGCQEAFKKLGEFKSLAFPFMIEHLEDKRQSIAFRNHSLQQSVGDACYWSIYYQLHDTPSEYSSYGYQRKGRDGELHVKPYWRENIFDEAGGLKKWLTEHNKLSYLEMQIACLNWLLEREKQIGASDAESYFENILPLEVRILERRKETGADVDQDLERLRTAFRGKDASVIPKALIPDKAEQAGAGQPATRSGSKSEGGDKPQPESEGRSR